MKSSHLIAAGVALGLAAWMASGLLASNDPDITAKPTAKAATPAATAVQVQTVRAQAVTQFVVAQGSVEPERRITVRAETAGRVVEVLGAKGAQVRAGDVIVRLDMNDREFRLATSAARVREAQSAYDAAAKLLERGNTTQRRIEELYTTLKAAIAERRQAEIEAGRTDIRAPFDGILNARAVEVGDYVAINGEIATIVDADPLLVRVPVSQQDIARVKVGAPATIKLATGGEATGLVRYISRDADQTTRTFRVEIEVANPEGNIFSGISAEAQIDVGSTPAHFVSPASLSLDAAGIIGVKVVDTAERVAFFPVEVAKSNNAGVWVTGLPATARVITIGHGFVRTGQPVSVVETPDPNGVAGADKP
jgi:multidrug efflux system membrane fusion protein